MEKNKKNKIKKIICVICSSVLIFTLIGCGKAENNIDNSILEKSPEEMTNEEKNKASGKGEDVPEEDLSIEEKENVEVLKFFNKAIDTLLNVDVRDEEQITQIKKWLSENADEQATKKVLKFYDSYDKSKNENTTTVKDMVIVKAGITTESDIYRIDYYVTLECDDGENEDFEIGNKEENAVCYIQKTENGKLKITQIW